MMNLIKMSAARLLPIILVFISADIAKAQNWFMSNDSNYTYIKPYAAVQIWGIYTINQKAENANQTGTLENVQDRANLYFRRARLGFKGNPYKKLKYNLLLQYDGLGKDQFTGTRSSANGGSNIGIHNVVVSYKISNSSDLLTISTGYFRPQISRESITSSSVVNTLEKAQNQTYARNHIVGRSNGRATGINIGGMYQQFATGFSYNVGVFNASHSTVNGKPTTGRAWSPLVVARAGVTFGLEEMEKYSMSYNVNYFNKRRGITISGAVAHQGETDAFEYNTAYSVDVLFNFDNINIDGEFNLLERNYEGGFYSYESGHIRMGYNIIIANKYFIEPTIMYSHFSTINDGPYTGYDNTYHMGVNWYINKKNLKLNLFYVIQEGEGVNLYTDGVTFEKGDYLGLGLQLII